MTEDEAKRFVLDKASSLQRQRIEQFVHLLLAENTRQNLISPGTIPSVWSRHIADAAQLISFLPSAGSAVDFGSGPGLPGVILSILQPEVRWHLVESRKLRITFLENVRNELSLDNVDVIGGNARQISRFPASAITARAFAPLGELLQMTSGFSTEDTTWVLPKGASSEQELAALPAKYRKMFHVEQSITDPSAGIIVGKGKVGFEK